MVPANIKDKMDNISKSSQHDKLWISVAISEGRFYQSTESKSEIFTFFVFGFACWLKNGMKTDLAVKNCDFLGLFTKNGKDYLFLSPKMKKLNFNW